MSAYEPDEAYDDLSARLDRLEEIAQEPEYETEDDYLPYQAAADSLQDGQTARDYLAAVAEQTRTAVLAQAKVDPTYAQPARDPVEEALEIVASSIPNWKEDAPAVQEYLSQSGVDLGPVLATGDSTALAKVLISAHMSVKLGDTNREIKRASQTMTGTNIARESETEWDRIASAKGVPRVRF